MLAEMCDGAGYLPIVSAARAQRLTAAKSASSFTPRICAGSAKLRQNRSYTLRSHPIPSKLPYMVKTLIVYVG
jgi:hypothetical protein